MAIVQISQITNRKGLAENLPQLAGAELGWSTNTRQLFIGNGTLQDGAPVIGNTEVLTEFSDILNFTNTYTYKGQAAGYTVQTGPTLGTPVTLSLQSWLDQFASVLDFGATGDGIADDTAAINRALNQLYCINTNPQIRRSLYFPAGVYRVTGSINIPPYATLYGEGTDNSVITMDADVADYVARTADSLQQTGANMGNAGAETPMFITIMNMGFGHLNPNGSVFLLQESKEISFKNVSIRGASQPASLTTDTNGSIGISFESTTVHVCGPTVFDNCVFSGLTWAINTDVRIKGTTVTNSLFDTLYQGVVLGVGSTIAGGPTGTRLVGNMFDNISNEGIVFGQYLDTALNASGHNVFYDVGNQFTGSAGTPVSSVITMQSNNNVSIGDMFERTAAFATTYPQIALNDTLSIATINGASLAQGAYTRLSGAQVQVLNDDTTSVVTFSTNVAKAFMINYTIIRNVSYRTGTIMIATDSGASDLAFDDNFVENNSTGATLTVTQTGTDVTVECTTNDTGQNAIIYYSVTYLA